MEIGIYQAKTNFAALIQRVEQGEEITITKRGLPVACLVQSKPTPTQSVGDTIQNILLTRQTQKHVSAQDINVWKNAGRA